MMPKTDFQMGAIFFGLVSCLPTIIHASGLLQLPPITEGYASHHACLAALDAYHAEHQRQRSSKNIAPNGGVPELELITDGVRRTASDSADYDATMWYHNSHRRDDLQEVESSHSYVHRVRVCEDKMMQTTSEDGYTRSTFEPQPIAVNDVPQRLDCRVRPEDCEREITVIEATIVSDPKLAALRRSIDERISDLKSQNGVSAAASRALDEDEAGYRRSLRRELYIMADKSTLTEEDRLHLRDNLSWRLAVLERMSLASDHLTGLWVNASGELEIMQLPNGGYSVSANPVDIDFLNWTCELSGEGRASGGALIIDLGAGEQLELRLLEGMLQSLHKRRERGYGESCGASGHAGGVWFSLQPQNTIGSKNN